MTVDSYCDAPLPHIAVDRHATIRQLNSACAALLQRAESDLVSSPFAALFGEGDEGRENARTVLERVGSSTEPVPFVGGDGSRLWGKFFVWRNCEGASSGDDLTHIVICDVSELHHLQQRLKESEARFIQRVTLRNSELEEFKKDLRRAKKSAEAAAEAKTQFLANMSHEIRTPLNSVIGMAELLAETHLSSTQREYVNMIEQSAAALLRVINDILDFSKIEAGALQLEHTGFRLREALGSVMQTLAARIPADGIEFAYRVAPDVPEGVIGDRYRLVQVITNLVGNALKFTDRGEMVLDISCVSARDDRVDLRFAVRDTGPGIPEEVQQEVFKAFAQADSSMTRKHGGTGLGLTISSHLVSLMGGRLELQSSVRHGSTFYFTLPFGIASGIAAPAPTPQESRPLRGLPVLIVDDGEISRDILVEMVRNWGMSPFAAESGDRALAALEEANASGAPFRLMLLDASMPEMDGFTVVDRTLNFADLEQPKIIMLSSARRSLSELRQWEEEKVARVLLKPVSHSELLEAIIDALGIRPAAQKRRPRLPRMAPRPLDILVAEDNLVNQRVAQLLLERRGHRVTIVGNGKQVLEELERAAYDLILMDVQMPELDGFQSTAEIRRMERASGAHLPIIGVTAHAMKGDRERCLQAGMDDYIAKPLHMDDLYTVVEGIGAALRSSEDASRGGSPDDRTSAADDEERSELEEGVGTSQHPRTVLVAEDDEDSRDAMSDLLAQAGYHVVAAENGKDALELLHSGKVRPCAILLDLRMPIMDGWRFRKEQKKDPSLVGIPVVAMSGHHDLQFFDAEAHLMKPVDLAPLVSTLERICGPVERASSS